MDTSRILDALRQGRHLQALVFFHECFAESSRLGAHELILRARILSQLQETDLATEDLRGALFLDGSNPVILLNACRICDSIALAQPVEEAQDHADLAHDLACRLLSLPISDPAQRRAALRFLAPDKLPLALQTPLSAVDRVTLVLGQSQSASAGPSREGDFQEILGTARSRSAQQGQGDSRLCVATDYFFTKRSRTLRDIQVALGADLPKTLQIAPLQPPESLEVSLQVSPQALSQNAAAEPWIILPVHDGDRVLARCLDSVLAELKRTRQARLLIVDDHSQQAKTEKRLQEAAQQPRVSVLRTQQNLGFVGAVNLGLQSKGPGPALLLNSDTYLPKDTLARMLAHLRQRDVGTVTPLSNNAGSFSVPEPLTAYEMPAPAKAEDLAALAYRQNAGHSVDVLNGNGFAMLISEDCLRDVGLLSRAYQAGYYEEVDYCLRATQRGYRHLAAVDCFVAHVGSTSFGEAKRQIVSENRQRLAQAHPDYHRNYEVYAQLDPLAPYRRALVGDAHWHPRKKKDTDARPDSVLNSVLRQLHISDAGPAGAAGGLLLPFDAGAEARPEDMRSLRNMFQNINLIRRKALEAANQALTLDHEMTLFQDKSSLRLQDGQGIVLCSLDLSRLSPQAAADFETSVQHLWNESRHGI